MNEKIINWNYKGESDPATGTGSTRIEQLLTYSPGLLVLFILFFFHRTHYVDWKAWQYAAALIIGWDVASGMVANSLNSCKRFYHTPYQVNEPRYVKFLKNHFFFTALHIYPILITALFSPDQWLYGIFWYGFMIVSALMIIKTPLYLKRPFAALLLLIALLLNQYAVLPVRGFEWFMPALIAKIVAGHLVPEEPYRPNTES